MRVRLLSMNAGAGEPLDHIRRARLLWRTDEGLTECGLPAADRPVLTYDEFVAKYDREGSVRAARTTCMTCWDRARVHSVVSSTHGVNDPVAVLARELRRHDERPRLRDELYAIASLIEAHRHEFDAHVAARASSPDLVELRRKRRRSRPA